MERKILMITSGLVHPSLGARAELTAFLKGLPGFSIAHKTGIEGARKLEGGGFHAVVIYLHRRRISAAALNALEGFIAAGGGLLALHSATASFKHISQYFTILGGRFRSHDAVRDFTIRPEPVSKMIFGEIEPFTIRDEIYLHDMTGKVDIHFTTELDGESVPIAWTRRYGSGRVCYFEPGHCSESLSHPGSQDIIARGLGWVSGAH